MRTTVDLAPDLMRDAKARAAERGESLKTLMTRALAAELGRLAASPAAAARVMLPLVGRPGRPAGPLTNADLEQALADADAWSAGAGRGSSAEKRRPMRRRKRR